MTLRALHEEEPKSPGAFRLEDKIDGTLRGMTIVCPCGCGSPSYLPFLGPGPLWRFDGNREKPTVNPSVQFRTDCKWHGWLHAGEWIEAKS